MTKQFYTVLVSIFLTILSFNQLIKSSKLALPIVNKSINYFSVSIRINFMDFLTGVFIYQFRNYIIIFLSGHSIEAIDKSFNKIKKNSDENFNLQLTN